MLKIVSPSSHRRSSEDRFVPLKTISVQVDIHAFAAEVCIKQTFINSEETSDSIEAVYCFPIEEQAAIYSFEAKLDDGRTIQGQIKEKKKAQGEYCDALQQGHGAFLMEQNEKSHDSFTLSVGSLKPQSKCEIEIHYVQELELIDDGQRIQFVLPTVIAPRYGDGQIQSPASTTSKYVQSAPYTISFSCSISSLPIASVGSPSHPIQVTTQSTENNSNPTMEVSLTQENTHLDRDIILNIDLKQQRILTYTLVEKQAIMLSLVPTLELCGQSGQINCEYIFVVDCSGSMQDESKINYARQAMSVFLKSLPIGSYFNIFRFGSKYEQFQTTDTTVEYNEETAKIANDYISSMKADLGGTELHSVLSHLQNKSPRNDYSRQIFLLTDGEITDVDQVLRLCQSMSNTTRIFSFGLGSSPSRALVKGLARVTNGSYLFIPPKTHVDVAVARQVDKALEPCLVNMKVQCHFNNPELNNYRISPKILPPIHAKQRLNVYIMMPKIIEGTLTGTIDFLTDKNHLLERITLTETEPSSSLMATRLAAKSIITDLQIEDYHSNSSLQARFAEQQKADKKQELIDLSVQHQILSPFTAFIAVETRTEEEKASAGIMVLREVPIEIRASDSPAIVNRYSAGQAVVHSPMATAFASCSVASAPSRGLMASYPHFYSLKQAQSGGPTDSLFDCDLDDSDECESEESAPQPSLSLHMSCLEKQMRMSCSRNSRKKSNIISKSRSRPRSRSRSRSSSISFTDQDKDDNSTPSDTIRQIIGLQNFTGLWSINDLAELISFLQGNSTSKNVDLNKICHDYSDKDQDAILSMIIMFIFRKYFPDDEPLWKPIIKKCVKSMKTQLGEKEYDEISSKIKQLV